MASGGRWAARRALRGEGVSMLEAAEVVEHGDEYDVVHLKMRRYESESREGVLRCRVPSNKVAADTSAADPSAPCRKKHCLEQRKQTARLRERIVNLERDLREKQVFSWRLPTGVDITPDTAIVGSG
eukprot:536463-Pleurochrysis_carterae.AAC.1